MEKNNYPLEIRDVEPEKAEILMKYFTGEHTGFVRVGPKGYILPYMFKYEAFKIYTMEIRPTDVFVVSYPRSGTTWTQELVWMVANDMDYETANKIPLTKRYSFLEFSTIPFVDSLFNSMKVEDIAMLPAPRFIKSHLPLSLLPPTLLDTTKVVYVARDPRDVVVSFFHHNKLKRFTGEDAELKSYWNYFIKSEVIWTPYFSHVLEAWEKRSHPNMLFLFYEELFKDMPAAIRRVAKFLGKEVTSEQVAKLNEHLDFKNFKKNKMVNLEEFQESGIFTKGPGFVRKGKVGGWRDDFDEEMTEQAEKWIAENLRGTDFRFPNL
ncbi:unnamed protein product [Euphydryas editha]|uniref:Sulfotransferase domain-containing protein n=1 Tax=Euphydryas editha TaxID=104508 RepID=A0AAU9THD7_EUPED|nr:unnamed protein product [Euphydryas editha]